MTIADGPQSDEPTPPLVFKLHIAAPTSDGSYPVHAYVANGASDEPTGADVVHTLTLPPRLVDRATRMLRPYIQFEGGDEREVGVVLARQLLQAPVRSVLLKGITQAHEQQTTLQFQLQLDAPELTLLPWEWLAVAGVHRWEPALLEDYGMARVEPSTAPIQPAALIDRLKARAAALFAQIQTALARPPTGLRVLLIATDARDTTLREIGSALEYIQKTHELAIDLLVAPSADDLRGAVRRMQPHVVHLLARVELDERDHPLLLLESLYEAVDLVALAGNTPPAVVLLDGSWREAEMLAAGATRFAYGLVASGLDAAVAFASPLYPTESALFAYAFYTALATGESLHQATIAGRRELVAGGASGSWGLPLLVRRAGLPAGAAVCAVPHPSNQPQAQLPPPPA